MDADKALELARLAYPNDENLRVAYMLGLNAGAEWQAEQFEKNRLAHCDALSKEDYDRETDFAMEIIEKEHRHPTFIDAINYGMRLQKERKKDMKEAVEGFIFQSEDHYPKELIAEYNGELKHGDKVRIIVLPKEDEK